VGRHVFGLEQISVTVCAVCKLKACVQKCEGKKLLDLNEEWGGQIFRTKKPKKRKRIRKQPFGFKTCPCTSWLIEQLCLPC
jgi:hypothetical protein